MAYTTVNNGSLFMNPKLYTGNGGTNNITGVDFQPDLVWLKERSSAGAGLLFDAVRTATKFVRSSDSAAEVTAADTLTAFNSDGFTLGADSGNYAANQNSETYASWNWKANGAGSANTDGDINSTVSANTTSGFSIVKYTGNATVSTIGHGLGVAPKMIITKNLSRSDAWPVDCRAANDGAGGIMYLNETGSLGAYGNTSPYPSTAPTNSVYSVGTAGNTNYNGSDLISYCFAEVPGFSKISQYTGNGSTDGPFVYTGFKPSFVMLKLGNAAGENWTIFDTKRNNYSLAYTQDNFNVVNSKLYPNSSGAEEYENFIDILSNGFKIRTASAGGNGNTYKYIYMAFAEAPLVGTNNIPANAR